MESVQNPSSIYKINVLAQENWPLFPRVLRPRVNRGLFSFCRLMMKKAGKVGNGRLNKTVIRQCAKLKIYRPPGHVGSSPTSGTNSYQISLVFDKIRPVLNKNGPVYPQRWTGLFLWDGQ